MRSELSGSLIPNEILVHLSPDSMMNPGNFLTPLYNRRAKVHGIQETLLQRPISFTVNAPETTYSVA